MHLRQHLTSSSFRLRLPRRTVRLRLTLIFGGLFLASGAALLAVTDYFWQRNTDVTVNALAQPLGVLRTARRGPEWVVLPSHAPIQVTAIGRQPQTPFQARQLLIGQIRKIGIQQHGSDLHHLLLYSGIALAVMFLLSIVLGWLIAGRILRRLRTITTTACDISATNLHKRLGLGGPDDELRELGDTFDELLERLERSFTSQSQFVANASHELRTPLATMRASVDVAVAKPGPVPGPMVTLAERLRREFDHVDRLIESFLALARAEQGFGDDVETIGLDLLVSDAIDRRARIISEMGLRVDHESGPESRVTGNATLLARMVENVIDNAVRHNLRGGWVRVRTEVDGAHTRLMVENGGQDLDEGAVGELALPFRRIGADRTGSDEGTGLGLSIVSSIVDLHGGTLELHALSGGGFQVVIVLPLPVDAVVGAPS